WASPDSRAPSLERARERDTLRTLTKHFVRITLYIHTCLTDVLEHSVGRQSVTGCVVSLPNRLPRVVGSALPWQSSCSVWLTLQSGCCNAEIAYRSILP